MATFKPRAVGGGAGEANGKDSTLPVLIGVVAGVAGSSLFFSLLLCAYCACREVRRHAMRRATCTSSVVPSSTATDSTLTAGHVATMINILGGPTQRFVQCSTGSVLGLRTRYARYLATFARYTLRCEQRYFGGSKSRQHVPLPPPKTKKGKSRSKLFSGNAGLPAARSPRRPTSSAESDIASELGVSESELGLLGGAE